MNRRTQHFAIGMAVLMLGFIEVASVSAAEPKSTQANWENLKQLALGQEVQAVLNDAKSYRGQRKRWAMTRWCCAWRRATKPSSGKTFCGSPREARATAAGTR